MSEAKGSAKKTKSGYSGNWKLTSSVGGKFPEVSQLFSRDSTHFIVLTSLELKVYNIATGKCIWSYEVDSSTVRDVYLDKSDDIWLAFSNGEVVVLNYREKLVLETFELGIPVEKIISVNDKRDKFVLVSPRGGFSVVQHRLKDAAEREWESTEIFSAKEAKTWALSGNRRYIVHYASKKSAGSLQIWDLEDKRRALIDRERGVLSVAVSDSGVVAAGGESGVIDVYYEPFRSEPLMRSLKWHMDAVLALSFSLDDSYLLSGGRERVLVFWQLDTDNTQLLPRLEGAITRITVDAKSEYYALCLRDDQIVILSAVDLVSRLSIAGVKADFVKQLKEKPRKKASDKYDDKKVPDYTAAFYVHPESKHLYIPTSERSLIQVYDPAREEQLYMLSVASAVQTGKVREELNIEDPKVSQVCFSPNGAWAATVDEWPVPSTDHLLSHDDVEINLKFWSVNPQTNTWELATRVTAPHGPGKRICDLIPAKSGLGFLTAASDGGLRLWRPTTHKEKDQNKKSSVVWSIRRIAPGTQLSSSAVAVAWSEDGSVVVRGFESTLQVISSSDMKVQFNLPHLLGSRVRVIQFVGTRLVALSKNRLVVWDVVANDKLWSIQLASPTNGRRLLAVDSVNERLALAVNYYNRDGRVFSKILLFRVDSPIPVSIYNHPSAVSGIAVVPGTQNFVFLDAKSQVHTLSHGRVVPQLKAAAAPATSLGVVYHAKVRQSQAAAVEDHVDTEANDRVVGYHSFDKVFDNGDESIEALFDRVLGVIAPRS